MDTIDLSKLMQRSYYITLGATSSLLEVIQDPTKREENFKRLSRSFDDITQELAEKGVTTEAEARSYVDKFIVQQVNGSPTNNAESAGLTTVTTTVTTTAKTVDDSIPDDLLNKPNKKVKASMRDEIQDLTEQLASLRSELEQFRK